MSQPDSSLARPIGAKPTGPSDRGTVYTMLLIISLVAVLVASLFLMLEQRQWYIDTGGTWSPNWMYAYIFMCLLGLGAVVSAAIASKWG